jgi:hypothetical protein
VLDTIAVGSQAIDTFATDLARQTGDPTPMPGIEIMNLLSDLTGGAQSLVKLARRGFVPEVAAQAAIKVGKAGVTGLEIVTGTNLGSAVLSQADRMAELGGLYERGGVRNALTLAWLATQDSADDFGERLSSLTGGDRGPQGLFPDGVPTLEGPKPPPAAWTDIPADSAIPLAVDGGFVPDELRLTVDSPAPEVPQRTAQPTIDPPASTNPTVVSPPPTTVPPAVTQPTIIPPAPAHPTIVPPARAHPTIVPPPPAHPTIVAPARAHPTIVPPPLPHPTIVPPATAHPTIVPPPRAHPTIVPPARAHPTIVPPPPAHPTIVPPPPESPTIVPAGDHGSPQGLHLGSAIVAGGATGGAIGLGSDLFRRFVLGQDISAGQMTTDTVFGAVEGAGADVASELIGHGITKAATPLLGAGAQLVGKVAGGGIVDGALAGITSTIANAGAVERGEVDAAQATANVAVDAGIALTGGLAGAAVGATIGSCVPVAGTAVGAGLGFVGGGLTSLGVSLLADASGFDDWAKQGLGEQLGVLEQPLGVTWSGIGGGIEGAKTGAMIGGIGGAAMGAINTGMAGAALGFLAGGPLGALVGGAAGAGVGAGFGGLVGAGLGAIPGAGIGTGLGVVDGLVDWLGPGEEQPGDFT